MARRTIKFATPLVIGTMIVVTVLAVVMMFLEPERLWALIVALLFLPVSMTVLSVVTRRAGNHARASRSGGNLRAGLVGAGVLLATTLGFSITDNLGLTGEGGASTGRSVLVFLPAIVAVLIDLLGSRLEYEAQKDPDDDGQ